MFLIYIVYEISWHCFKSSNPYTFVSVHISLVWSLLFFKDLDMVVRTLLAKNGESNGFIREDSERALGAMVEGVTPQRALIALISGGAT